ncbi:hypothetical protein EV360DRAFT_75981, partial [Lentinula raphanica]
MAKRRTRVLCNLYAHRSSRSTSLADGPGYIYAFCDHDRWKIGMARDFARRRKQWNKQCPFVGRIWMTPIVVSRRRRAESLAHLLLELNCSDRPRLYCSQCRKTHTEIFRFSANWSFDWKTIIEPLLLRAARDEKAYSTTCIHPTLYVLYKLEPNTQLFLHEASRCSAGGQNKTLETLIYSLNLRVHVWTFKNDGTRTSFNDDQVFAEVLGEAEGDAKAKERRKMPSERSEQIKISDEIDGKLGFGTKKALREVTR